MVINEHNTRVGAMCPAAMHLFAKAIARGIRLRKYRSQQQHMYEQIPEYA